VVLRGQIPIAWWWGGVLHGHVGFLLDNVVVLIVLVFLIGGGGLDDVVGLPRLEVVVAGGSAARSVLPREEIVPELSIPVLAVKPQRLREIVDAAAYLRIQLRARRRRRARTGTRARFRCQPWGRPMS
jgi:hypothetical protein